MGKHIVEQRMSLERVRDILALTLDQLPLTTTKITIDGTDFTEVFIIE